MYRVVAKQAGSFFKTLRNLHDLTLFSALKCLCKAGPEHIEV